MASEPNKCRAMVARASVQRAPMSISTTSPENVEKVVSPPKNPVMTSKRHSGASSGRYAKKAKAQPIKKPPSKFAHSVPRGMGEGMERNA